MPLSTVYLALSCCLLLLLLPAALLDARSYVEVSPFDGSVQTEHPPTLDAAHFDLTERVRRFNEWFAVQYEGHALHRRDGDQPPSAPSALKVRSRVHPSPRSHRIGVVALQDVALGDEYLRIPLEMVMGRSTMMRVPLFQFLFRHARDMYEKSKHITEEVGGQMTLHPAKDHPTTEESAEEIYSKEQQVILPFDEEGKPTSGGPFVVTVASPPNNDDGNGDERGLSSKQRSIEEEKRRTLRALRAFVGNAEMSLAAFLLYERYRDPNGEASFWKPYLDLLPTSRELHGFLHAHLRAPEEMEAMYRHTSFPERARSHRRLLAEEHEDLLRVLRRSDAYQHRIPVGFPMGAARSLAAYEWAMGILHTREIWWNAQPHLVPMLDFVNCDATASGVQDDARGKPSVVPVPVHRTTLEEQRAGTDSARRHVYASTRAAQPFGLGMEITENYGQSNPYYVYTHGFHLDRNPVHDCALLHEGLLPERLLWPDRYPVPTPDEIEQDGGFLRARLELLQKVLEPPPKDDLQTVTLCVSPHVEQWDRVVLPAMRIHSLRTIQELRDVVENPRFSPYKYFNEALEYRAYESLRGLVVEQAGRLEETLRAHHPHALEAYETLRKAYRVQRDRAPFTLPFDSLCPPSPTAYTGEKKQKKKAAKRRLLQVHQALSCRYLLSQIHLLHIIQEGVVRMQDSIDTTEL